MEMSCVAVPCSTPNPGSSHASYVLVDCPKFVASYNIEDFLSLFFDFHVIDIFKDSTPVVW